MSRGLFGLALAVAVVVAGCAGGDPKPVPTSAEDSTPPVDFTGVYEACSLDGLRGATLGDSGSTLEVVLLSAPIESLTVTADEATCVALALELPDATLAKIGATEPGDPAATDSWGDINLTWKVSDSGDLTFIYEARH